MTKLKDETIKLENTINRLKIELDRSNKEAIQGKINEDKKLIKVLEELLENEDIQKRYPKYEKLKKLFYILPSGIITMLTIVLILISILLSNITFTTFLPLIILAADYITYHSTTKIFDNKIKENEKYKDFYELYGNKQYSAKRTLKDLKEKEKDLVDSNSLLIEYNEKENKINNLEGLLNKLYAIRDSYIEQTIGEKYQDEIKEVVNQFEEYEETNTEKKLIKK